MTNQEGKQLRLWTVHEDPREVEPKLVSVVVEKETNEFYFLLGKAPAFGWSKRIPKTEACLSPEHAIAAFKNIWLERLANVYAGIGNCMFNIAWCDCSLAKRAYAKKDEE